MSEPRRLRQENVNTAGYWDRVYYAEQSRRAIDPDRFGNMAKLLNRDETVLDMGGGCGEFLIFLRAAGFTGTLMHTDHSLPACEAARMSGFPSHHGNLYNLPFASKQFDSVVLGEVVEHLDNPSLGVAEAARLARRAVILSTPYMEGDGGHPEHVWAWDLDAVYTLLSPHGRVRMVVTSSGQIIVAGAFRE